MDIAYNDNAITIEEYNYLRRAVGWSVPNKRYSKKALENSLYICSAHYNGVVIGSGRIVGDGSLAFCIQDVMVCPEYQRSFGIGRNLMYRLLNYIKVNANETADIYCMSAKEREGFYIKMGFIMRPTAQFGAGMFLPYETLHSIEINSYQDAV